MNVKAKTLMKDVGVVSLVIHIRLELEGFPLGETG
jgi:hypothetical protein